MSQGAGVAVEQAAIQENLFSTSTSDCRGIQESIQTVFSELRVPPPDWTGMTEGMEPTGDPAPRDRMGRMVEVGLWLQMMILLPPD
jgi:hypothetical protein